MRYSVFITVLVAMFAMAEEPHPPIAIEVELDKPQCITLAIENASGNRVRNIVVEELLPAGKNTIWWDGMDDHGQKNVRVHGGHDITGSLVAPGEYTVRGIARDPIDIFWKFCPYNPNNPVRTSNRQGQWLSDHRPPCSVLWEPQKQEMILGAQIAEGAHSIIWLDKNGKKIIGNTNIGTHYMGPVKLCRAAVSNALPQYVAYALGVTRSALLIVGITDSHKTETLYEFIGNPLGDSNKRFSEFDRRISEFSIAVAGKLIAVSWASENRIKLFELGPRTTAKYGAAKYEAKPVGEFALSFPRGLCFDDDYSLFAINGNNLVRFDALDNGSVKDRKPFRKTVVEGLDEPRDVILNNGKLYISCHGQSHQVWVYDAKTFELVRKIGHPGRPSVGPYDECKMFYPQGVAVDGEGRLWVAEEDYSPKRVSMWNPETGDFIKAYYGPTQYGGGGKVDPKDPTRFYYSGMEFKLGWESRTEKIVTVFNRGDWNLPAHVGPNDPVYLNGRQYMVNVWNAECNVGTDMAAIYRYDSDGIARPVALAGQLSHIKGFIDRYESAQDTLFAWSDLNDDQKMQPNEMTVCPGVARGFNLVADTLDLVAGDGTRLDVQRFTESGVPVYDCTKVYGTGRFISSQYQQVAVGKDGSWATSTYAPEIGKVNGMATNDNGRVKWAGGAYTGRTADGRTWFAPNAWLSLHAAQLFPTDRQPLPGEIVGATKINCQNFLLGPDKIECFALNSNSGIIYIFSVDGYYIAPLFKHGQWSEPWGDHVLKYDESVKNRSSDGEGFYQAFTKCDNGKCYIQALNHTSSICEVTGLDSVHRLPVTKIMVTHDDINKAKNYYFDIELSRIEKAGAKDLDCTFGGINVNIDGKWDDWDDTEWAFLDEKVEAAVKCDSENLYVAWHTCHRDLTLNSGAAPWMNMFKSGGALDLMIGELDKDAKVKCPKRLLISEIDGKPMAILYEPKSNRKGHSAGISSPNRTVNFDFIGDVTDKIRFAKSGKWPFVTRSYKKKTFTLMTAAGTFYEVSIPLSEIGLAVIDGVDVAGDIGVLVGDGASVRQRLYWNNKGTQNLFDAPDEAILRPELWGKLKFRTPVNEAFDGIKVFSSETGGRMDVVSVPTPSAAIRFDGDGELAQRKIGTSGWAVFRFDPMSLPGIDGHSGWRKSNTVYADSDIVTWPVNITDPEAKDGLMHGAFKPHRFMMMVDGKVRNGHIGGGGSLAGSFEQPEKSASWDISLNDGKSHLITLMLLDTADKHHLYIVQNGEKRSIYDFTGKKPLCFVQFTVTGNFKLLFETDKWTNGEKRNLAYISGIYVD